jgi:acylaminoacyl-peptidase
MASLGPESVYEDAAAYCEYASAAVELSNAHVSASAGGSTSIGHSLFTVVRSVRDIDGNQRRQFLYTIPLFSSPKSDQVDIAAMDPWLPPQELPSHVGFRLPSPSGDKVLMLINVPSKEIPKDPKPKQVLEIWTRGGQQLERRVLLDASLHGKVIWDPKGFGTPAWNEQETAVVYPAERAAFPAASPASFFEATPGSFSTRIAQDGGKPTSKSYGTEHALGLGKEERWGEKYSKQAPLLDLFCINVETGKIGRVRNVPGGSDFAYNRTSLDGYSLGQPVWSPGGTAVVYVGWDAGAGGSMPRRLGLIYCCQRPKRIYASSVANLVARLSSRAPDDPDAQPDDEDYDSPFVELTPDVRIATSPRFSPRRADGSHKLVFLAAEKAFDTHFGCFGLHSLDWNEGAGHEELGYSHAIVVPQVWNPTHGDHIANVGDATVAGLRFPGIYELELPSSCFASPDHLLLTTCWGSTTKVVRITLDTGRVEMLRLGESDLTSDELLCTARDGSAVLVMRGPQQPGIVCRIAAPVLSDPSLPSTPVEVVSRYSFPPMATSRCAPIRPSVAFDFTTDIQVLRQLPDIEGGDNTVAVQSILLLPSRGRDSSSAKPPLIVIPHGGPHSVSTTSYLHSYAFLCSHGYALLLINYRGSTGFGQASIETLPTHIGVMDVADVVAATTQLAASGVVDPDRIGICGGSHGGFLAAHCTSQHPDLFKVAVLRNPVVNIASMVTATDIPDWCYVEATGSYDWTRYRPPTQQELNAMWSASPIQYIQNVKAPTLVTLGLLDLRVPPSQGLEWYYSLRSIGVPTSLLTYPDDDHAIGAVASEADHWVNIKRWFDRYLL